MTGSAPAPRNIPAATEDPSDPEDSVIEASQKQTAAHATTAGLSHQLDLRTRYYRATIPIWVDETNDPDAWKRDFLSSEASEVIKAVGAWIVLFRKTTAGWQTATKLMNAIRDAVHHVYGGEGVWDGVFLCVGLPSDENDVLKSESAVGTGYEQWDEESFDLGFELVDGEITGDESKRRNAAGELRGTARIIEALEANEWDNVDDLDDSTFGLLDDDAVTEEAQGSAVAKDETQGFRLERTQMEKEFAGLKLAMAGGVAGSEADVEDDQEEGQQVEELERMMRKVSAARDMSAHLPEAERKKRAKKTVDELVREWV